MASRKERKYYCNIMDWLEATDPSFAEMVQELCLTPQLSAKRHGVTLLYPSKDVRSEFLKLGAEGDGVKAQALFEAHVVPTYLGKASDFTPKIGTNARVLLGVKSASGKKVTLDNGAVLEPQPGFEARPRRAAGGSVENRVAIWAVTEGKVPTSGKAFDPRSLKTGGVEAGANMSRALAIRSIEEAYLQSLADPDPSLRSDLPLLRGLLGLLATLKEGGFQEDMLKALCALDRNPACLYILVEPYKTTPGHYLSDACIAAWGGRIAEPQGNVGQALLNVFDNLVSHVRNTSVAVDSMQDPSRAAVFTDPSGIDAVVAMKRSQLLQATGPNTYNQVVSTYQQWLSSDTVQSGGQPVWPESVKQAFQNGCKLWQDGFRYYLRLIQYQSMNRAADPVQLQTSFKVCVRETFPGSNYSDEVAQFWAGTANEVAKKDRVLTLAAFINSSDFYYIPRDGAIALRKTGGSPDDYPLDSPHWNGDLTSHRQLERHSAQHEQTRGGVVSLAALQ